MSTDQVGLQRIAETEAAGARLPNGATGALRQLTHERNLLADALGRVLVASGVAGDVPLTGPQLLLLADDLVEHLAGARP